MAKFTKKGFSAKNQPKFNILGTKHSTVHSRLSEPRLSKPRLPEQGSP